MSILKRIPYKVWLIILISYALPILVEESVPISLRDLSWFILIVPTFFWAYYFGTRIGVISSLIASAFFLFWEWSETVFENFTRSDSDSYTLFVIAAVNIATAVGSGILANRLTEKQNELENMAITDPLTKLYNRWYIQNYRMDLLFPESKQNGQRQAAVFFIDLDRFKLINDSLGHRTGDVVLQDVAQRLLDCVSEKDIVARLAGDEFILVLSTVRDNQQVKEIANKLIQRIAEPFIIAGMELYLTASVGISMYPFDGWTMEELLAHSDVAMYRAKEKGKNRYQFYFEEMNAESIRRMQMEKELYKALEENQLSLYYQPRLNIKNNTICGVEALLRWEHPELGNVAPSEFIPIAEETGLIIPIGEWALREACKQNKKWQDAGYNNLRVSVNISARQLQSNLVKKVSGILQETGLEAKWLELEITESLLMRDVGEIILILDQLKELGLYLSIDDFGTGYSSLNYLKRLPVDMIKIDKSFVDDIPDETAIIHAIITLGHSLQLEVVAEGVEKEEQVHVLKMYNCDFAQGFLYSPPISANKLEQDFLNLNHIDTA